MVIPCSPPPSLVINKSLFAKLAYDRTFAPISVVLSTYNAGGESEVARACSTDRFPQGESGPAQHASAGNAPRRTLPLFPSRSWPGSRSSTSPQGY